MNFKKVLAILLAVCMIVPMAACGKDKDPNKDGAATTTVQQAEVTDGNGESTEGETTTVADGETTTAGEGETTTAQGGKDNPTKPGETTKKPSRTSNKKDATTKSRPSGVSGYIGGEVQLKEGTKRADAGVDFGGKTFLHASMGTGAPSAFTQGGYDLFKQKYNGTIKMDGLGSSGFMQSVASKQLSGEVYDIIFMNATTYPAMFVQDCAIPVTEYISTADLWKNAKEGGLSEAVIQDFSWNGEAYAMGGNYLQVPYVVFYNKKIFRENGMEDPATIAANAWTWDKFLEMGKEYTDADANKYFVHKLSSYTPGGFFTSYNTELVAMKGGVVKENTKDTQLYNALDMLQKMHFKDKIVDPAAADNASVKNAFISGKIATLLGSPGYWKELEERAKTSSLFGNSADNLGMIIAPRGKGSNKYGLMDNQWYVAGKGTSDPRVAICYAMVESTHNTLNVYSERTPAQYRDALCKIMDGSNLKSPAGSFSSGQGGLPRLEMIAEVCNGKNVSSVLTSYKSAIQSRIDAACK